MTSGTSDFAFKPIRAISLTDEELRLDFDDGVLFFTDPPDCCESRYFHTDDQLSDFVNAEFIGVSVEDGPKIETQDGDVSESSFMKVVTARGVFTVVAYNNHNGYYGGIHLTVSVERG